MTIITSIPLSAALVHYSTVLFRFRVCHSFSLFHYFILLYNPPSVLSFDGFFLVFCSSISLFSPLFQPVFHYYIFFSSSLFHCCTRLLATISSAIVAVTITNILWWQRAIRFSTISSCNLVHCFIALGILLCCSHFFPLLYSLFSWWTPSQSGDTKRCVSS